METQEVSGASPLATGLSSAAPIEPVPVSPVPASIPSADRFVAMVSAYYSMPGDKMRLAFPEYAALDLEGDHNPMIGVMRFFCETAQAIEARRAETQSGSVHESAVGSADAHNTQVSETPSDTLGEKA